MRFNRIEYNPNINQSSATVTFTEDEIREVMDALRTVGNKSRLRSEFYLLFELAINGAVDGDTFTICKELRGDRGTPERSEE